MPWNDMTRGRMACPCPLCVVSVCIASAVSFLLGVSITPIHVDGVIHQSATPSKAASVGAFPQHGPAAWPPPPPPLRSDQKLPPATPSTASTSLRQPSAPAAAEPVIPAAAPVLQPLTAAVTVSPTCLPAWVDDFDLFRSMVQNIPDRRSDKFVGHHYHTMYWKYLGGIVRTKCASGDLVFRILEIGLGCKMGKTIGGNGAGGGIQIMRTLFVPSQIRLEMQILEFAGKCVEDFIAKKVELIQNPTITIHVGSQVNEADLSKFDGANFDAIIDDAAHLSSFMYTSLLHLFPRALADGGAYFMEDIQGSCKSWSVNRGGAAVPAGEKARVDGTEGCMLTKDGETTFFNYMVQWQRGLIGWRKTPKQLPGCVNIDVFQEAAVFEKFMTKAYQEPLPPVPAVVDRLAWVDDFSLFRSMVQNIPDRRSDKFVGHFYHAMYWKYLGGIVRRKLATGDRVFRVLEIGLGCMMNKKLIGGNGAGGGIQIMRTLFASTPISLDMHVLEFAGDCVKDFSTNQVELIQNPTVTIHVGSQVNETDLSKFDGANFDAIIDDAAHLSSFMYFTLVRLFRNALAVGGAYFMEDIQGSCKSWGVNRGGAPVPAGEKARVQGTAGCMYTEDGETTFFNYMVQWQKGLIGWARTPKELPGNVHIDVFQEAAVFEKSR